MSAHDWYVWGAIGLLTVVIVFSRASFLLLPARWRPGARAEQWLRYAPLAALAALVVPETFGPLLAPPRSAAVQAAGTLGWLHAVLADARAPAGIALLAVGAGLRRPFGAFLTGIAVYLGLRLAYGGL